MSKRKMLLELIMDDTIRSQEGGVLCEKGQQILRCGEGEGEGGVVF